MGYLDPEIPGTDPELRTFFWSCYEKVFQMQDAWLGSILDAVPANCMVALVSDHGMQGMNAYANTNAILAQAGLLSFDSGGRVDLTKTKVLAPPWADFGLVVNTVDRKGGIVPLNEKAAVLAQAKAALLAARDDRAMPIVTSVLEAETYGALGLGGPAGADAFLDFAPGLYPSNRRSSVLVEPAKEPGGVHGYLPFRHKMLTVFYARGKGLAKGVSIPAMRQTDIMPTLCRALGAKPPPQAVGVVVGQALAN
jgi:hypothetical protein